MNVFGIGLGEAGGCGCSHEISTAELQEAVRNGKPILLIDVRSEAEVTSSGMIPTAINIPLEFLVDAFKMDKVSFEEKYKKQKPDKDTEIIFACYSGSRSKRAHKLAIDIGYNRSRNYKGGWMEWSSATC